jgi:predicted transcriptional regulator
MESPIGGKVRPGGPRSLALRYRCLAGHAGGLSVTTETVARIERDEIEPRMTTLRKLAQALEVDPAEPAE